MGSIVVLGLGSNRGDSKAIIMGAAEALKDDLMDLSFSSLYDTAPLHVTEQRRFINAAVLGYYGLSPLELLTRIHCIEMCFGRDRIHEQRWGERYLDIDILLFGDLCVNEPELTIPHPLLKERRFALEPLIELLPNAVEPVTGLLYAKICAGLPDQGVQRC